LAYLKFSRDKRGYEHFYLVQPSNRGKARPRVLYWFRTPPGVKVGRSPFDPEMRRALEVQNPGVEFDWEAITHTPIPPPVEPERWRERRRVERAFRESEESASIADASEQLAQSAMTTVEPMVEPSAVEVEISDAAEPDAIKELNATGESEAASHLILIESVAPIEPAAAATPGGEARETRQSPQSRQGRRRRRRRGRRKPQVQGSGFTVQGSGFPVPGSQVPGSPVQGPEPDISNPQGPAAIQDSGEPEDENLEP
jgi:hypothetical protein